MSTTKNQNLGRPAQESSKAKFKNLAGLHLAVRNAEQYSHLTPLVDETYPTSKAINKNVRTDLKKHFPEIKFSVKGDYDRVSICWTDGPTVDVVKNVVMKFESWESDHTGDYRDPCPSLFNDVFGGKKYVRCNREYSDEKIMAAIKKVTAKLKLDVELTVEDFRRGSYYNLGRGQFMQSVQQFIYDELTQS